MTENDYHIACRDLARNGTLHFFDPWKEPGKYGAWRAAWKRIGVHRVMMACIERNEWPSEIVCAPAEYPRDSGLCDTTMELDMRAAKSWIDHVMRLARRGELPAGVAGRLIEGGMKLPKIDGDVIARRERIMKGFELLRNGRHEDARAAVMDSGASQEPQESDSASRWYDDM